MDLDAIQDFRRNRLKALIGDPEFGGNLSALGRKLGYKDGVYVRQMRDGERPITEKTVLKIEALPKRAGWFSGAPEAPSGGLELADTDYAMLQAFQDMASEDREAMLKDALEKAERFRRLAKEAISRHTSAETAAHDAFRPKAKPPSEVYKKPAARQVKVAATRKKGKAA